MVPADWAKDGFPAITYATSENAYKRRGNAVCKVEKLSEFRENKRSERREVLPGAKSKTLVQSILTTNPTKQDSKVHNIAMFSRWGSGSVR